MCVQDVCFPSLPQVYTWGCNDEGALGHKTEEGEEYIPKLVEKLGQVDVVQISAGDSHTAALSNSGNVYCWGVFRVRKITLYTFPYSLYS